jgi:hypothetical protein
MTDKDHTGAPSSSPHIPCPFVYANGRACSGHVVRFESYKAHLAWSRNAEGIWNFAFRPRSYFHIFCSEKATMLGSGAKTQTRCNSGSTVYQWKSRKSSSKQTTARPEPTETPDANPHRQLAFSRRAVRHMYGICDTGRYRTARDCRTFGECSGWSNPFVRAGREVLTERSRLTRSPTAFPRVGRIPPLIARWEAGPTGSRPRGRLDGAPRSGPPAHTDVGPGTKQETVLVYHQRLDDLPFPEVRL